MEFASDFAYVSEDANVIEVDEGALHNDLLSNIAENNEDKQQEQEQQQNENEESEEEDNNNDNNNNNDNDNNKMAVDRDASKAKKKRSSIGGFFSAISSVFSSSSSSSSSNNNNNNSNNNKKERKRRMHLKQAAPGDVPRSSPPPPPPPSALPLPPSSVGRRFQEKADTNVVALKFGTLIKEAEQVWAGDVIYCKGNNSSNSNGGCKAALSSTAKILSYQEAIELKKKVEEQKKKGGEQKEEQSSSNKMEIEDKPSSASAPDNNNNNSNSNNTNPIIIPDSLSDTDRVWICEFCQTVNVLDIADEEIPKTVSRDYVIDNPSAVEADGKNEGKNNHNNAEDGMVIFVIDTSGSMCVTTPVPGKFSLKGFEKRQSGFDIPLGADERAVPIDRSNHNNNNTYVSRLQCVQASIQYQIENFMNKHPSKKIGLITFSNEVLIYGSGDNEVEVITGDKLKKQDVLLEIGKKINIEKSVKESGKKLIDIVFGLEEAGQTALGPALVTAIGMASKIAGSTIVLCTDGLSNIGIGALDGINNNDEKRIETALWYSTIGDLAKLNGTTVSIISIKGSDSSLEELAKVAEATGGAVDKVDPLTLKDNFSSILSNPVIATQVSATFLLHQGLKFRNEIDIINNNLVIRNIGNVTEDSEITFEYEIDPSNKHLFQSLSSLPFQLQINYTKLNGMKLLRIISKSLSITTNKSVAESNAKFDILAANVSRSSAKMAERGDYDAARIRHAAWGKFFAKNAKNQSQQSTFNNWVAQTSTFDQSLQKQSQRMNHIIQNTPIVNNNNNNNNDSSSSSSSFPAFLPPPPAAAPASSPFSSPHYHYARQARDDESFSEIAKFKVKSSAAFK